MARAGVLAVVFVMHRGRGAVPVRWRVVSAAAARISFVVLRGRGSSRRARRAWPPPSWR